MNKSKLYCYVDETGQDTEGKMFIVATIVVEKDRDELLIKLENIESKSGKHKRKWINTRKSEKEEYLKLSLYSNQIKGRIYFSIFNNSKSYEDLTVLVIGKAINLYIQSHDITDYKATIVVDGLNKTAEKRMAKSLRELGVKARKVRGERDESNALLRLTDSVAGLVRDDKVMLKRLIKERILNEL